MKRAERPSYLPVGVRVFATPVGRRRRLTSARRVRHLRDGEPWPAVLAFDCETDASPAQRLLYGYYQLGPWRQDPTEGDWRVHVTEEGWFCADDLPTRDPHAFATIQRHVDTVRRSLPPENRDRVQLLSRREFIEQVFYRVAYDGKALVVGFNLPFDLAQLAERWTRTRQRGPYARTAGGFSLELLSRLGGHAHGFRPRVVVKHIDRTRALIQFGGLPTKRKGKKRRTH